jgi:hypothetical protein
MYSYGSQWYEIEKREMTVGSFSKLIFHLIFLQLKRVRMF